MTGNDDRAAEWAVRLDAEKGLLPPEEAELESWLNADPARAGSLLRAQAALACLDRGRALAGGGDVAAELAPSRRRLLVWALAGGSMIAAGTAGVLLVLPHPTRFATAVGEVRRVPLADGSVASLNTRSRLEVTIAKDRREVALIGGEAWFQVAHDHRRPFVVEAGDIRVRAVGTAFSVRRRDDGGIEVLVTEGVVAVWRDGDNATAVPVSAGQRATLVGAVAPAAIRAVDAPEAIERALAWRGGELALDGDTLGDAVAEINRYNPQQIDVDPALSGERLVGLFRTNDPRRFAEAAAAMTNGHVKRDGDRIRIMRTGNR